MHHKHSAYHRSLNVFRTWIQRTFLHARKLSFGSSTQHTVRGPQHDRKTTNVDVFPFHDLLATRVLNIHVNISRVRQVAKTTFMRCIASVGDIGIHSFRHTNPNSGISIQPVKHKCKLNRHVLCSSHTLSKSSDQHRTSPVRWLSRFFANRH